MENKNKKYYIIWIDKDINSEENHLNLQELKKFDNYNLIDKSNSGIFSDSQALNNPKYNIDFLDINPFEKIESAINFLKTIRFKLVYIVVKGELFVDFVKKFQQNLNDIYTIPKIIIYSPIKRNFDIPLEIRNKNFYLFSGIKTSFKEIKDLIFSRLILLSKKSIKFIDPNKIRLNLNVLFDEVKDYKDIILPINYNALIDTSKINENHKFIEYLNKKYTGDEKYNEFLYQVSNAPDIPVELLSKYYIRLYSMDEDFNKKMYIDFEDDNNNNYLPLIETIYKGVGDGALKPCKQELYSAQYIDYNQISNLLTNNSGKKDNLPIAILFSKSFLTFNKEKEKEQSLLLNQRNALLIVEQSVSKNNFYSQADIEELSPYHEKKVVFFPYSPFGVESIKYDNFDKIYIIRLVYLGKYYDEDKIFKCEDHFPESNFKFYLEASGLIDSTKINKMKIKELKDYIKQYKKKERGFCDCNCSIF